jgi:hypothetical protein
MYIFSSGSATTHFLLLGMKQGACEYIRVEGYFIHYEGRQPHVGYYFIAPLRPSRYIFWDGT